MRSRYRHWRACHFRSFRSFHYPPSCAAFAPRALPRFITTTGALTAEGAALRLQEHEHRSCPPQLSLLHVHRLPTIPPPITPQSPAIAFTSVLPAPARTSIASEGDRVGSTPFKPSAWPTGSGLRLIVAGSPDCMAESSSSSCGLVVHLPLLSTPPHGDAVTVDY